MNATELMQRVIAHGADAKGIEDRFCGNAELYAACFQEFLEEPNFALLRQAVTTGDHEQAFQSAHALKGLAGNLGITAFYSAICALVESLREHSDKHINEEYAEVERQRAFLQEQLSDSSSPPAPPAGEPVRATVTTDAGAYQKQVSREKRFIPFAVTALSVLFVTVGLLLHAIYINYTDNILKESADHLMEISYQLKLYMEDRISNDWKIARSVGDSISSSKFEDDDEAIVRMLLQKKAVWGVTDIKLYTQDGHNICSDGDVDKIDVASDIIVNARELGEYMTILESDVIYTVPIDTPLRLGGSRIVAVSLVQSMGSFLDGMGFSSFDGKAWMYLTKKDGIVISMLSNEAAMPVFNFLAATDGWEIAPLESGYTGDDLLTMGTPAAYLLSNGEKKRYVVSIPINTSSEPLRLFYLAPEAVVNETMNGFSQQLALLSLFVVVAFTATALVFLVALYRGRKRLFDKELLLRDRMLDQLIRNSHSAFGLFTVNQREPVYVSSNAPAIIGDRFLAIDREGPVFTVHNNGNTDTNAIRQINAVMRSWDGSSDFKSGYILNDQAVPPNYFELQFYPTDGDGNSFVGIAQDVTLDYQREKATADALDMAERANEAKSRFLSNMSHDIRTPMNAIVNMTDFAMESMDQPKKLGMYLQTIRESSDHLLRLINDVLDMSRIESGQTVIESQPFDLLAELHKQADMIRPLCAVKRQTLITNFDGLHTAAVKGDQLKFSQIIMNLLSNAVKFTPEKGAIRFSAVQIPSLREEIADVRITVEDNGMGIAPAYLGRIFEPFSRADDRRVSKIEGTGLGLSICHSYVTAMGGTITCESEEGEGSIFVVELFFQTAEGTRAAPPPLSLGEKPFLGMRCLICEDNAANQLIASTMLERLGFMTDVAGDGVAGLKKFRDSNPGAYDIIYMDIHMPGMDGYQTAVAIRECGHPQAATIPIVAMTANVFAEDIEKARIAGMDGHLGKPVLSAKLVEETDRVMKARKEKRS